MITRKEKLGQYLVIEGKQHTGEVFTEVLEPSKGHEHSCTRWIDEQLWGDIISRRVPEPILSWPHGPERRKEVKLWIEYRVEVSEEMVRLALMGNGDEFNISAKTPVKGSEK